VPSGDAVRNCGRMPTHELVLHRGLADCRAQRHRSTARRSCALISERAWEPGSAAVVLDLTGGCYAAGQCCFQRDSTAKRFRFRVPRMSPSLGLGAWQTCRVLSTAPRQTITAFWFSTSIQQHPYFQIELASRRFFFTLFLAVVHPAASTTSLTCTRARWLRGQTACPWRRARAPAACGNGE
jgi:hypothetical protein